MLSTFSSKITLDGYDLLGRDECEGVRYAWNYSGSKYLLESAAFCHHRKGEDDMISGYTTSVSLGCVLRSMGYQCKFCRTGNVIPFVDFLSAADIAKQNVFMVLADLNCTKYDFLHSSQREFAYMGQGEPGLSYSQVRLAIKITDIVLDALGQTVYRHIIATSGIPEMIHAYKSDLGLNYFNSKVTLHFSLHLTEYRSNIMPIEKKYSYKEVLRAMDDIASLTGEKPCIGILLFSDFSPRNESFSYSNRLMQIEHILDELDPQKVRLSFCEFNQSPEIGSNSSYSFDEAHKILSFAQGRGFEAKLFSSFGKEESSACGMLGGKKPNKMIGGKWEELVEKAEKLVADAITKI